MKLLKALVADYFQYPISSISATVLAIASILEKDIYRSDHMCIIAYLVFLSPRIKK